MGLLQQASLVTTPNAVKAGKLYSIIPTNGAGDLDVVRATTATYVGSNGLIQTAGNNIARLDYTNASCPSILIEPQRTNLCLQSEMFTQSPWSGNAIITANTDLSPSGTLTADTLNDNSTSLRLQSAQVFTVTPNVSYTTSVFIKKTTGSISNYPALQIFYSGVSNRIIASIINTTTGTFNSIASGVSPVNSYNTIVRDYGNYWRVEITTTDNASNTSLSVILLPAFSSDGITTSVTATGSAVCWGAQLELGSNATSYIPTTTIALTRNADVISKSGVSSLIGQSQGSIFVDYIKTLDASTLKNIISLNDTTANNLIEIWDGVGSGNFGMLIYICRAAEIFKSSGGGQTMISPSGRYKICLTYLFTSTNMNFKFFINGILIRNDNFSFTAFSNPLSRIGLGNRNNAGINVGNYNIINLFPTALSDAQAIQLTTL